MLSQLSARNQPRRRRPNRKRLLEQLEARQLLAADVIFSAATTYPVGEQPESVAAADFDGDGHLDLVVANRATDSLTFFRGRTDGQLDQAWPDVAVHTGPLAVVAGDLNLDGAVDVVIANEGSDSIAILYGEGNGRFASPRYSYLPGAHESLSLGDLNEDGRLDIVVATNFFLSDTTIGLEPGVHVIHSTLEPGDADGFLAPQLIESSPVPSHVITEDFNNDGHLDVVIAHEFVVFTNNEEDVTLVLGDGAGGYAEPIDLLTGGDTVGIESGDLNDDGLIDLVVVDEDHLGVLMNQGNGAFAPRATYDTGSGLASATIADLDADGDLDVAVANVDSPFLSVMSNNGDGTLTAQGRFETGVGITQVLATHLDDDQLPDLVVLNRQAAELSILKNRSTQLPLVVNLDGNGGRYTEDFDMALAAFDGPGARLPVGWSLTNDDTYQRYTDQAFPVGAANGLMSAGLQGSADRALTVGVTSPTQSGELTWTAEIQQAAARSLRVKFDIEAWLVDPAMASLPGEASFNVVLEADSGQGFSTVHDFGRVTTGERLTPLLGATGKELWKTDGVDVSQVADIAPGQLDSDPSTFAVFNDELYFVAAVDSNYAVYKYNGADVSLVEDLGYCDNDRPREPCSQTDAYVLNDALYYTILPFNQEERVVQVPPNRELTYSYGSDIFLKIDETGTSRIPNSHNFQEWARGVAFNDAIVVTLSEFPTSDVGGQHRLWMFDGQELERVGIGDYGYAWDNSVEFGGELYFQAGASQKSLFKTDGNEVTEVLEIPSSNGFGLVAGEIMYVFSDHSLWKVDGEDVEFVTDFEELGDYRNVGAAAFLKDELFFTAAFSRAENAPTRRELWKYDGDTLSLVTDLLYTNSALFEFQDLLYFTAIPDDGSWPQSPELQTLWKTDGVSVTEVASWNIGGERPFLLRHDLFTENDQLFFLRNDSVTGGELWRVDDTSITQVTDINPGPGDSFDRLFDREFAALNGELLFVASNGSGGPVVMNGNDAANRFEFNSGEIAAQIPVGSKIRLRFGVQDVGANVGYVYGIDNFEFEIRGDIIEDIPGDANRDGIFNSSDLVLIFVAGEYEDDVPDNSTWEEGDWNGDGEFTSSDLIAAFQAGHYVVTATPAAVPFDVASLFALDDDEDRRLRHDHLSAAAVDEAWGGPAQDARLAAALSPLERLTQAGA